MGKTFHDMSISNLQLPFFKLSVKSLIFFILIKPSSQTTSQIKKLDNGITRRAINSTHLSPLDDEGTAPFKPGIAAILAILAIFISITFLLLLYMKHCKSDNSSTTNSNHISRDNSGVESKIVQSLPLFRFSSLRGQKDGLECAVCLNKFDPEEMLRLLPSCKHAFHVECVDTWLDAHATCPLCRHRVDPQDLQLIGSTSKTLYNYRDSQGKSMRSKRHSSSGDTTLEIIVENPDQDNRGGNSNSNSNSKSKSNSNSKSKSNSNPSISRRGLPLVKTTSCKEGDTHRLEHRIIVSGDEKEARRRWSDMPEADYLYLVRSEMIVCSGDEGSDNSVINS